MWRLLGLRPPTDTERREAEGGATKDELQQMRAQHGEPPAAAFARVRAFYAPFNTALASQLDDRASELYFEDYPELRPDLDRPVRTATATATSAGGGGPQRSTRTP